MRVVLMLLIVVHHAVVNSGVMDGWDADPGTPAGFALVMMGMWGKSCINPFVLVTGYFMCGRGLTARKTARLLLQIAFWFVAVNAFLLVIGEEGPLDAAKALATPLREADGNFIASYLVLYALIPVLNAYIRAAGRCGVAAALAVLLWTQTVLPTFLLSSTSFSEVAWYVALYLMGASVRLWPARWMGDRRAVGRYAVRFLSIKDAKD